jgi:predicted nucleic acid-binding protein
MKIVLDTNVLVTGIFFSGPPADILRAWSRGKFEWY